MMDLADRLRHRAVDCAALAAVGIDAEANTAEAAKLEALAKRLDAGKLVLTLREVNAAFAYGPGKDDSPEFWLRMAESQIKDARAHFAAGEVEKGLAEIADLIPVAFDALEKLGKDPEAFTENRIRTRILPRVAEVSALYHAGNGYRGVQP